MVNGAEGYGFILSAKDGDLNGDGSDIFRIKVWQLDSKATTALGGGCIVVHSVKNK